MAIGIPPSHIPASCFRVLSENRISQTAAMIQAYFFTHKDNSNLQKLSLGIGNK